MDKIAYLKEQYKEIYPDYQKIQAIVDAKLRERIGCIDVNLMQVTSRIKTWPSIKGKLARKADKYSTFKQFTDNIGFRIICYFSEQVDVVADYIEDIFDVDWENSCDKRRMLSPNTFGYLSLHFICKLRKSDEYPDSYTDVSFEIQIRTVLQHAWAEIEHDLGYKTVFAVPRDIRREFSRVAGLLEIADESFSRIREATAEYELEVRKNIEEDKADDMTLDRVTLWSFMKRSNFMQNFLEEIAAISGARILDVNPESYLKRFDVLGINTLGELKAFIEEQRPNALRMARELLTDSEIDELISTVGFYYVCRAKFIFNPDGIDEVELRNYVTSYLDTAKQIKDEEDRIKVQWKKYHAS